MSFQQLNLIEPLQRALVEEGYNTPTPIQLKSIPDLLTGKDLIGIAQTGTGKTAAFVLPILQRMKEAYPRVLRTLVLAPTRELAAQIGESFAAYGKFLKFKHTVIFGGVSQGSQVNALSRGVDIVVATPGRLLDLMNQGRVNLRDIEFFVLDEADRMLDMGFIRDIRKIIVRLPQKRQSLFFSATMSPQVSELASQMLRNPVRVEVAPQATTVERVRQCVFFVDANAKEKLLVDLLLQKQITRVLVFTRTKHKANKVVAYLDNHNVRSDAIHGNKSQGARTLALSNFKSGKTKVLVATDIAARGIDIDDISHVINFELPTEPESYVHRIGRTARAGAEGVAFSFCAADERDFLRDIERLIRLKVEVMPHAYHSDAAENASGSAARPPPKHQNQRGGSRNFRSNRGSSQGRSDSRSPGRSQGGTDGRSRGGFQSRSDGRSSGNSQGGSQGRSEGRSVGRSQFRR